MEKEQGELDISRRRAIKLGIGAFMGLGLDSLLLRHRVLENLAYAQTKEITSQFLMDIQAKIETIQELRVARIGSNSNRLPPAMPNGYPQTEILYDYQSMLETDLDSLKNNPKQESLQAIIGHWDNPPIQEPDNAIEIQRQEENEKCLDQGEKTLAFIKALRLERTIGKLIITNNYQHGAGLASYVDRKAELTVNSTWCWEDLQGFIGHETAHALDLHGGPDGENLAISLASPKNILSLLLEEEQIWQELYKIVNPDLWAGGFNDESTGYIGNLVLESGYTYRDFEVSSNVPVEELGRRVMIDYIKNYSSFRESYPNIYDDVSIVTNWQARRFEDEWLATKQADLIKSGGQGIEDNLPQPLVHGIRDYLERRNSILLGYSFTFAEARGHLIEAGFN